MNHMRTTDDVEILRIFQTAVISMTAIGAFLSHAYDSGSREFWIYLVLFAITSICTFLTERQYRKMGLLKERFAEGGVDE